MASSANSRASRAASPRKRIGSETPRIYTPPLRKLTPETSLGFAAVEFAQDVCGIDLFPWQRWLLIHSLEMAPGLTVSTMHERGRLDPIFRFRKVIVLVARQNGKSTLSQVLSLFFLYVLGTDLVLGTAQDLDTAEEVWEGALDIIDETPELAALADKPIRNNGKKAIRLKSGERYKVKAANRRAGRGLSGDLILLDELREHQSWEAWGAITKTTMARPAAMIWALSNAGDATSVVLRYLRKSAHAALGDPDGINADDDPSALLPVMEDEDAVDAPDLDDLLETSADTLGIFEWSASPGCDVMDRDGWAAANPSMGHGISERTLAGDAKDDPEWVFRTECLCQWSDGSLEGPFPPGTWEAGLWIPDQHPGEEPPAIVGAVYASVDVSTDRSRACVAFAGRAADGTVQIELVARRSGTEWVAGWLQGVRDKGTEIIGVTGQSRGAPVSDLLPELESSGLPVIPWAGSDLTGGTGRFFDAVRDNLFRHFPQPPVDVAAATAVPKITDGGAFLFDRRKSPIDIAPLQAFAGAYWLLIRPDEPTAVSAYEERGLIVI